MLGVLHTTNFNKYSHFNKYTMNSKTTFLMDFFGDFSKKMNRKRISNSISIWFTVLLTVLMSTNMWAQTVTTDKADYAPGETVQITGSGFMPGENVLFSIIHIEPNFIFHSHEDWEATTNDIGDFTTSWFVYDEELNTTLYLSALGLTSGYQAYTSFTDGSEPKINSINPLSGVPGTIVTIVLNQPATSISSVLFGSNTATSFIFPSPDDKTITATVPNGSGSVDVTVNGYWDNKGNSTTFTDTFKDKFNIGCTSPSILTPQPANQSITYGENASFTVVAAGTGLTYQWQELMVLGAI